MVGRRICTTKAWLASVGLAAKEVSGLSPFLPLPTSRESRAGTCWPEEGRVSVCESFCEVEVHVHLGWRMVLLYGVPWKINT